jgi:hypothetical protein
MTKTTSLAGAALALVAALSLSACGGGQDPAPPAAETEKMKQYAACMQEYGIDIPLPDEGEPAGGLFTMNTADPKTLAGRTACARLAPAAHAQGKPDPAEEDRALKLAECLRMEGIKAKDPASGSTDVDLADGVTYSQQELVDAYTTCNQQVPATSK